MKAHGEKSARGGSQGKDPSTHNKGKWSNAHFITWHQESFEEETSADDEVIVVGDTPYDVEAARKLNLHTIGMLCGGFPEAELRAAGCVAIFRDPADLLDHYKESPLYGHTLLLSQVRD